ncbi:MAG TPA: 2-hydroxy-3-oxopropionate reductase [Phycisphaerae bacterium]|jgi:2-hydroxy-3-oxopropionate reductase
MEKIGFIGVGIMGQPMVLNLLKTGFSVVVHNRSPQRVAAVVQAGATAAQSPAAVARQCDVVITMLPDSPDVEVVVLGAGGILEGTRAGQLLIDMSTIAPETSKRLAQALDKKGIEALDAPVSGGEVGAKNATLSIMVGGTRKAFERAMPVFAAMGKNIVHIGDAGAGQVAKACNQIVVGVTIQAVAEALTLAKKAGVDVGKVREALLGGFAQSKILDVHGQRVLDGNWKPGFKVKLHRKDMGIVMKTGKELGVPVPASELVAGRMDALIENGEGEMDHSSLVRLLAREAGLEG